MVRLDDAQSAELDRLSSGVGVAAATLAHSAVVAMLRCYREKGVLTPMLSHQIGWRNLEVA